MFGSGSLDTIAGEVTNLFSAEKGKIDTIILWQGLEPEMTLHSIPNCTTEGCFRPAQYNTAKHGTGTKRPGLAERSTQIRQVAMVTHLLTYVPVTFAKQ